MHKVKIEAHSAKGCCAATTIVLTSNELGCLTGVVKHIRMRQISSILLTRHLSCFKGYLGQIRHST